MFSYISQKLNTNLWSFVRKYKPNTNGRIFLKGKNTIHIEGKLNELFNYNGKICATIPNKYIIETSIYKGIIHNEYPTVLKFSNGTFSTQSHAWTWNTKQIVMLLENAFISSRVMSMESPTFICPETL